MMLYDTAGTSEFCPLKVAFHSYVSHYFSCLQCYCIFDRNVFFCCLYFSVVLYVVEVLIFFCSDCCCVSDMVI